MTGDQAAALAHARWIVELEQTLGISVEASVQQALDGTALLWLLNHAYVAAQVGVVPAALIWLYRRERPAYLRLRDTAQPGDPRATAPRVTASTTKRRSVADPRIAIAAKR